MQLGGCDDACEDEAETAQQIPVVGFASWHEAQIVDDDHDGSHAEEAEQQDRHPDRALLLAFGDGRGVAAAFGLSALGRYSAPFGLSLRRCVHAFRIAQLCCKVKPMQRRVLVIDNFDSFVYVLVHYLGTLGAEPIVYRNNQISHDDFDWVRPDSVLISPGPGRPEDAGAANEVVKYFAPRCPVLGVCLGHQSIAQVFGGEIVRAGQVCHGKTSNIQHDGAGIFTGIETPLEATRYHSLVADPETLPEELAVTATTDEGIIMGIRHREYPTEGLQFHPESVLTESGYALLENFLAN